MENEQAQEPVIEHETVVSVAETHYEDLVDASLRLSALEGAGVDQWEGYESAMEEYISLREARNEENAGS